MTDPISHTEEMASSSSSFPPAKRIRYEEMASSSSSSTKPYEVFISFRGEDTRNKFVSHLYSALTDRGIRAYLDQYDLKKGETISTKLVKAIQDSRIATVVLSTNYASSKFCLDELAEIIDCKTKLGLVVFPIFYEVDPSDIRNLRSSFGEALTKHQDNPKVGGEKVQIWRDALKKVADLAGDHITDQVNEAECIKEIVEKIYRQLPVNASTKLMVGLENRISEIKEKMEMGSKPDEVVFIGLCGMGGIGKTTTARAIFEDCKNEFEGSCFLPNVRQSKNTMKNLQMELLRKVLKTSVDICDVVEGSNKIKERLSLKKILLVIDDVDHIDQVNALAKERDWFGGGSRIIITTRNRDSLKDEHIVKYEVETLDEEEAIRLFCLYAFKVDHPPEDYKGNSLVVVKYASGLPLAVEVLGKYFQGKQKKSFWDEALRRLKEFPQGEIMSSLLFSYDGLQHGNEKNIFLNIACFFRSYKCRWVKRRLIDLYPEEGVDVLVQRSLIHINKDDCIEMHDLLQEMGLDIVRKEANGEVERYSRLWLEEDIVDVLSREKVPSQAEWIFFDNFKYNLYYGNDDSDDEDDRVLFDFDDDKNSCGDDDINLKLVWEGGLANMKKLRFLEFSGNILEGNHVCDVSQISGHVAPCPSLKWFCWSKYPGHSLPESFHPRYLVHLIMRKSNIRETPDFTHMPNLEELNLSGSKKLVNVHATLGDHTKIKLINLSLCIKIKRFPKINQMESLEVLNLAKTKLRSFPEIYGNLNSLRKLRIQGFLYHVEELRIGPPIQVGLESSPRLVSLEITGSSIVQTPDFRHLPYLEMLDLSDSEQLVEVHESLGNHKRIKFIYLDHCSQLKEFPIIRDMVSLEVLILSRTCLQSFPEITGNVNRLVKLDLDYTEITMLPGSIVRATNLETISLRDCKHLRTVDPPLSSSLCIHSVRSSFDGDLIVSQGGGQFSGPQIYLSVDESLEELPETLLSRVVFLHIQIQRLFPKLTRWIYSNLVDLLRNYQHLCKLQLHPSSFSDFTKTFSDVVRSISIHPSSFLDFTQTFSDVESMTNMLQKRDTSFEVEVYLPDYLIPRGFQYRICGSSVNVFIKSINKLKGICICGLNAKLTDKYVPPAFCSFASFGDCDCDKKISRSFVVTYIPINDIIKEDRSDWDGKKECTLFELKSNLQGVITVPIWGLSLVYNEGEGEVDHPIITNDSLDWRKGCSTMKLKIAESRGIQQPLPMQQLICVENEGGSMVYRGAAAEAGDPFTFTYHGSFEEAKNTAKLQNKWLLLHVHPREDSVCNNELVDEIIKNNFIFWGVKDEESDKIRTDYKILNYETYILVIDPLTGQMINSFGHSMDQDVLEGLMPYLNRSPADHRVFCVGNKGGSMVYGVPRTRGAAGEDRLGVAESSQDNRGTLDSLYCPPFALMNHGSFEEAKDSAKIQNKWLLLNLQSTEEFSSYMLNLDTWANEVVAAIIKNNFIFWQMDKDAEEGHKLCTDYRIDAAPIILVIDPLTGHEIRSWHGMVQPESLLEDLTPYLDRSPTNHPFIPAHKRPQVRENTQAPPQSWKDESDYDDEELQQPIAASMAGMNDENVPSLMSETVSDEEDIVMAKPNYPPLPEEPMSNKNLLCRIGFRLPDGRRLLRNFWRSDPIQLLWSCCYAQLEEAKTRQFRLAQTIPGSEPLDYHSSVTLGDSGLANSMISVTWL